MSEQTRTVEGDAIDVSGSPARRAVFVEGRGTTADTGTHRAI